MSELRAIEEEPWEVWYYDNFDRECPPSVEVRGNGLARGLKELWLRHLHEGIDGFSSFQLSRLKESKWVVIRGDIAGARALRGWIFRGEKGNERNYKDAADDRLLEVIAAAHARLILSGQASEPILHLALTAPDCSDFELGLSAL